MTKAYIFGCSHAAGSELFDHDIDREYLASYPALLAKDLGHDIENHAIPGGSNDAIFRALFEVSPHIRSDDMIVFCWTVASRAEIWSADDQQYLAFAPGCMKFHRLEPHAVARQGRFYGELIKDHTGWMDFQRRWQMRFLDSQLRNEQLQDIRNIIAANELARPLCSTVLNIRSAGNLHDAYAAVIEKYRWPVGVHNDFWRFCREQDLPPTAQGHFGHRAHRLFADHIKKCM